MKVLAVVLLLVVGVVFSCKKDKAERLLTEEEIAFRAHCDTAAVSYTNDVLPIINANCAISGCHAPPNGGNWDYTTYAGLKAKVDNGALKKRAVEEKSMPPTFSGLTLTQEEIDILHCWILDNGPNN